MEDWLVCIVIWERGDRGAVVWVAESDKLVLWDLSIGRGVGREKLLVTGVVGRVEVASSWIVEVDLFPYSCGATGVKVTGTGRRLITLSIVLIGGSGGIAIRGLGRSTKCSGCDFGLGASFSASGAEADMPGMGKSLQG